MKTVPIQSRVAALAEDDAGGEVYTDVYRPEAPARLRAVAGAVGPKRQKSPGDFADAVSRAGREAVARERAYEDDPFDNSYLEEEEEERKQPRTRRRVPVQRAGWLAGTRVRIGIALGVLLVLTALVVLVRHFFLEDPRFRIESASSIQIVGNSEISRTQLLSVFGEDVGRDLFRVPLAARRNALKQLPWVEHATVMRLLPNQLRVSIVERVPIAFVRAGNTVELVDATGMLLNLPMSTLAARHYSFPVVSGINEGDTAETRAERMQLYQKFVTSIDGTVAATTVPRPSQQLSEVDVSDSEDVRASLPSAGSDLLVHFGDDDFAARYKTYQQHLKEWRQQYPHLAGIDLRYDRQTVLQMSPGTSGADAGGQKVETTPALTATPAHAASNAAGKKPVAKKVVVLHKPSAQKPASLQYTPGQYIEPKDVVKHGKGRE